VRHSAVAEQVGELEFARFEPVDGSQQDQVAIALAVAQMGQHRDQVGARHVDEAQVGALLGECAEREQGGQALVKCVHDVHQL
jgi:hypothetical protein